MQLCPKALAVHLEKELAPLYTIVSDEILLAQEAADSIRAVARTRGFVAREVLDVDRSFKWSALEAASGARSLFDDKKIIELRIPGGKPGKDGSEALQRHMAALDPQGLTLITLPRLDRTAQKATWVGALQQAGVYLDIPKIERAQLPVWIAGRLKRQQQSAESTGLAFLADHVEGNLLAAHQEIEKLALLYPPGRLAPEQIRDSVANVARYDVFQLGEALLAGDVVRLARMLDGLRREGEALPLVLWAMTEELRTLLKLKTGLQQGLALPALMKANRVWGARERLMGAALQRLQSGAVEQALRQAAAIDRAIKGLPDAYAAGDDWNALLQLGIALSRQKTMEPARRP